MRFWLGDKNGDAFVVCAGSFFSLSHIKEELNAKLWHVYWRKYFFSGFRAVLVEVVTQRTKACLTLTTSLPSDHQTLTKNLKTHRKLSTNFNERNRWLNTQNFIKNCVQNMVCELFLLVTFAKFSLTELLLHIRVLTVMRVQFWKSSCKSG